MPTFNRADTIKRAIRSVQAQTFTDWELIVVDDGSTDDTAARIEGCDPRLKLIRQENQGTAGARNTGLRASAGSYIAFLDSDDEWLPHHLELCVRERYWGDRRDDPEISALLGFRQFDIARLALARCERATALKYLKAARRDFPKLRRARYLQWLITLIPGARFSCRVYIGFAKASYILGMIGRNEISIGEATRKLARRLFNAPFIQEAIQWAIKR
jgi:glycosyltransferase involved in cell wall biosynthesis